MTNNENSGAPSARREHGTDEHGTDGHGADERPDGGQTVLKASSADAILAMVPHLLGFYPSKSLVVIGLSGKRNRVGVTFRYDLPDPGDSALTADMAEHAASVLRRERLKKVALVGYGPAEMVLPAIYTVGDFLGAEGIGLLEVLRADSGRYWSVLCDDPECCPVAGRAFDPGSHPLAVAMTEAGMCALPDRAALARTLQSPAGSAARIRGATRQAEGRLADLAARHWADGGKQAGQLTARVGRTAVQSAIRRYRDGGAITSADELAWLSVLLADLRVRDDAWARMDPAHQDAHCRLWTDVVKAAAREYAPAPAALLAFVAWQSGDGALAAVAVDRALAARPGYSMALLLDEALRAGLPPSAARLPMTPAEVAASYEVQEANRRQPDKARSRGPRAAGPATKGARRRPSG